MFRNGLDIGMRNSLLYSACTIALGLVLGLLAAYGFERYHFPFKKILFYIVIAGIPLSIGSAEMCIRDRESGACTSPIRRWPRSSKKRTA